jgi:hypothetical protein
VLFTLRIASRNVNILRLEQNRDYLKSWFCFFYEAIINLQFDIDLDHKFSGETVRVIMEFSGDGNKKNICLRA